MAVYTRAPQSASDPVAQSENGLDPSQRDYLRPHSPAHDFDWRNNVPPMSNDEEEHREFPVLGGKRQSDSGAETTQSLTASREVVIDPSSRAKRSLSAFTLAADAMSVLLPLALLGFLIMVILLDSEDTTDASFAKWNNAITVVSDTTTLTLVLYLSLKLVQLATVFPIVFAAIVGRLTYEICRWKLEKGSTVGSLEQLLGSRTFGGTILTQFHLRGVNALGIGLIIFWSFSPLGAQSLLRILSTDWSPNSKTTSVVYQNTEMTQGVSLVPTPDLLVSGGGQPMEGEYQAIFQYLGRRLSALILAPESLQKNYVDLWGNFKVPFLEGDDDNDGWQETASKPERETWTSLAGLPLANLPHGNSTFSVETSYLDVRCDNITTVIREVEGNNMSSKYVELYQDVVPLAWPDEDALESEYEKKKFRNGSWHGISMGEQTFDSARWSIATDRFVDPYWTDHPIQSGRAGVPDMPTLDDITAEGMDANYKFGTFFNSPELLRNETGINAGRARLLVQTEGAREFPEVGRSSRTVLTCDIRQRYVESQVLCQQPRLLQSSGSDSQNCSVTRQRRSQQQHASENITHLSFPSAFWRFTRDLPKATFMGYSGRYDLLHAYLREPDQMGPLTSSLSQAPALWEYDWPDKDNVAISRRLTQVLNTYLLLSSVNQQEIMIDTYYGSIRPNSTTTAETTELVLRYKVSKLWSILGIASCAVFLAGGIASVVFTHMASSPEVLGYVSTVMRDSKILDLDTSVGHMSALDISRKYKKLRVRFGYNDETSHESPVIGVGREAEIASIRRP